MWNSLHKEISLNSMILDKITGNQKITLFIQDGL